MSNENNNSKYTSKTKVALNKIKVRNIEIERLTKLITEIKNYYDEVIKKEAENVNFKKNRTWFDDIFSRREFKENGIRFYIEFTIIQSDVGGNNLKGSIIYGASRPDCFSDCFRDMNKICSLEIHEKGKTVFRRCDLLEDKPLIQFLIDEYGVITPEGESEKNGWWIYSYKEINKESDKKIDKKSLAEFHFLTLNKIWNDALEWVNEKILP